MKIAIITIYSAPSVCGVWSVVYPQARRLAKKGHDVHVFTSNKIHHTEKTSPEFEIIEGVSIHRSPVKINLIAGSLLFDFEDELLKLKPDIIHTHSYRHPHSEKALKVAKKLNIPCFLTTHAPFVDRKVRGFLSDFLVSTYDFLKGKKILNKYTKVFAISKWEMPYLFKLGVSKDKIIYCPTGVSEEYFKNRKRGDKILYMGRISDIKDVNTFVKAAKKLPELNFEILGPIEEDYELLESLNVKVTNKKYNIKEGIEFLRKGRIFVLPSKREGAPQILLEALAAGKIVISSKTQGGRDIIKPAVNGYLFEIGNVDQLVELIQNVKNTSLEGIKTAENYKWDEIVDELERTYLESI